MRQVGSGAFASVWMARMKANGSLFAIKMQDKNHILTKGRIDHVIAERDILSRLSFPFIVKVGGKRWSVVTAVSGMISFCLETVLTWRWM